MSSQSLYWLGYGETTGESGSIRSGLETSLSATVSPAVQGCTDSQVQWQLRVLALAAKRPGVLVTTNLYLVPKARKTGNMATSSPTYVSPGLQLN
jgi:hypothetical protein